jgi:two-component sensor histidine kinase
VSEVSSVPADALKDRLRRVARHWAPIISACALLNSGFALISLPFGTCADFALDYAYVIGGAVAFFVFQLAISIVIDLMNVRRSRSFWLLLIAASTLAAIASGIICWRIINSVAYGAGIAFWPFLLLCILTGLPQNILWAMLHLFIRSSQRALEQSRRAAALREAMLKCENDALTCTLDAGFLPDSLRRVDRALKEGAGRSASETVLSMAEQFRNALAASNRAPDQILEPARGEPLRAVFHPFGVRAGVVSGEEDLDLQLRNRFLFGSIALWLTFFASFAVYDLMTNNDIVHVVIYYLPQAVIGLSLTSLMSIRIVIDHSVMRRIAETAAFCVLGVSASACAYLVSLKLRGIENLSMWGCWVSGMEISFVLPIYLGWSAAYFLAHAHRREFRRLRAAAEMREAALNARNAMLRQQVNPHFLFNALNALYTLILDRQFEKARAMIAAVRRFLDRATDPRQGEMVALASELETQDAYLEVERARFGDRLMVERQVALDLATARVPHLILQPLVENAVKYSLARTSEPVLVEIRAGREGDELVLQVRDSGAPGGAPGAPGLGVGLKIVEGRLKTLYGSAGRLICERLAPQGFLAEVRVPFVI